MRSQRAAFDGWAAVARTLARTRATATMLQNRAQRSGAKQLVENAFSAWTSFARSDVAFGRLVQTVARWLRSRMATTFRQWREDAAGDRRAGLYSAELRPRCTAR